MTDSDYMALEGDLTVLLHFSVDGLFVRSDLLGTSLSTERHGLPIRITLPSREGALPHDVLPPTFMKVRGHHGDGADPGACYEVMVLQVEIDTGRGLGDEGPGNAESALIRETTPVAASAVRHVLDWARTRDRQRWLAPSHMTPPVVGVGRLMNAAGEISGGYGTQSGVIVMLTPEDMPTGDVKRAFEEDVPEPESLLAEARWAVWPTNDPDTKRAVLLAAIALEIKTPSVLRAKADSSTEGLLDVLFSRPDQTPMSVNFLLNEIAEVVLGQSLKQTHGDINKQVKKLFDLRNGVAHRGQTPSPDDARKAVAGAEHVFEWLDQHISPDV